MTPDRRARFAAGATIMILLLTGCAVDDTTATTPSASAPSHLEERSAVNSDRVNTELIDAAWANDVTTAQKLIAQGADVNAKDATGQSAYLIAASEGYTDLLDLTLANGADVGSLDSFHGTGLIRAAERGHADIVGRLIQYGVDIDHVNNLGWTALHESLIFADRAGGAARGDDRDYLDTVRVIVAAGGDIALPTDKDNRTPTQLARDRALDAQTQLLEEAAALGELTQSEANDRLLAAAESGNADQAALALRQGAQIETRNHNQQTPLVVATKHNHPSVVRLLLYLGADPNAKDSIEDSAFLYAGAEGLDEILALTLDYGADVTSTNRFGGTALIPASEHGHVSTVKLLLEAGVPVDHVNNLGWTALHEAIVLGNGSTEHVETVGLLLASGADPTIRDGNGVLPRDLAAARGYNQIVDLIERAS